MKKLLLFALVLGVPVWVHYRGGADREALQQDCDGGEVGACFTLGKRYRDGAVFNYPFFSSSNFASAAILYERACDGGEMRGCTNLGNMYRTGEGVPQDSTHAASLYKQACDGGFRPACGSE